MNPPRILLVDPDPKNIRILRNNFLDLHFEVDTASNDTEALEKVAASPFDAILTEVSAPGIDGYTILERAQQTALNRDGAIIFLTQKSDVWNRVKSFKLGAKDYILKPIHVREIVGRVIMVLNRRERNRRAIKKSRGQFCGRLEEIGAVELVEVFGVERKSGILSLHNEYGVTGKIIFKFGAVIQAAAGVQRGEEAVLKMLSWKKGRFAMVFASVEDSDEIGVSNMGLLLQGAKRMEQREELLQHLPALETILVTTQNFKKIIAKKALAADLEYFVSLFDGERSLGRIIDESKYDEITTLQRILKLYELGFLHARKETPPADKLEEKWKEATSETTIMGAMPNGRQKESAFYSSGTVIPPDLEKVEASLGVESTEDLLHEDISAIIRNQTPDDRGEGTSLKELDLTAFGDELDREEQEEEAVSNQGAPDFSRWHADSRYEKDLFYDLRHAEEDGQDLFAGDKEYDERPPYADLEQVIPHHPADALLKIESVEELADSGFLEETVSEPPRSVEDQGAIVEDRVGSESRYHREAVADENEEDRDVRELERNLYLQEKFRKAHGSIVILGNNRELCKQMIAALCDYKVQEKSAFQPADSDLLIGTAEFKGGHSLNLIALSLEHEFAPILDYFAGSLLGFIFLVDGRNVDWGYQRYLRQALSEKTNLPAMVVFSYNEFLKKPLEVPAIRQRLGLRERDGLQLVSDFSVVNSRRIIFRLFETYYRPQPKQGQAVSVIHRPH